MMSSHFETPLRPQDCIFVALDTADLDHAVALSRQLVGYVGGIKLGLEFFNAHGLAGVRHVLRANLVDTPHGQTPNQQRLFLDLKFHDIPQTVAGAVRSAMACAPFILNVHAAGGQTMMKKALDSAVFEAESLGISRPMLVAVSVLTSMDEDDIAQTGVRGSIAEQVVRLAQLTQKTGLDGVVCSAHEIALLRAACGPDFKLVVPGIRPEWACSNDQKRMMTPREALDAGADYLVIGRPVTKADNPLTAIKRIIDEIT